MKTPFIYKRIDRSIPCRIHRIFRIIINHYLSYFFLMLFLPYFIRLLNLHVGVIISPIIKNNNIGVTYVTLYFGYFIFSNNIYITYTSAI